MLAKYMIATPKQLEVNCSRMNDYYPSGSRAGGVYSLCFEEEVVEGIEVHIAGRGCSGQEARPLPAPRTHNTGAHYYYYLLHL